MFLYHDLIGEQQNSTFFTPRMRTWQTSWAAGTKARSSFGSSWFPSKETKSSESVDAVNGTYPSAPEELDMANIS